jgi:hypothetical protein
MQLAALAGSKATVEDYARAGQEPFAQAGWP